MRRYKIRVSEGVSCAFIRSLGHTSYVEGRDPSQSRLYYITVYGMFGIMVDITFEKS
jgi:hypothetical protein